MAFYNPGSRSNTTFEYQNFENIKAFIGKLRQELKDNVNYENLTAVVRKKKIIDLLSKKKRKQFKDVIFIPTFEMLAERRSPILSIKLKYEHNFFADLLLSIEEKGPSVIHELNRFIEEFRKKIEERRIDSFRQGDISSLKAKKKYYKNNEKQENMVPLHKMFKNLLNETIGLGGSFKFKKLREFCLKNNNDVNTIKMNNIIEMALSLDEGGKFGNYTKTTEYDKYYKHFTGTNMVLDNENRENRENRGNEKKEEYKENEDYEENRSRIPNEETSLPALSPSASSSLSASSSASSSTSSSSSASSSASSSTSSSSSASDLDKIYELLNGTMNKNGKFKAELTSGEFDNLLVQLHKIKIINDKTLRKINRLKRTIVDLYDGNIFIETYLSEKPQPFDVHALYAKYTNVIQEELQMLELSLEFSTKKKELFDNLWTNQNYNLQRIMQIRDNLIKKTPAQPEPSMLVNQTDNENTVISNVNPVYQGRLMGGSKNTKKSKKKTTKKKKKVSKKKKKKKSKKKKKTSKKKSKKKNSKKKKKTKK
jgi:hypothetical protein